MKRILEISKELHLKFENVWVLGNRFPENVRDILEKEVEKLKDENIHLLGFISNDDEISRVNLTGGNLLNALGDNPAYQQAKDIFAKIL